jgi:hypothetical protein
MAALTHFPCPSCSEPIDAEFVIDARPFACPHCGAQVTAPAAVLEAIIGAPRANLPAPRNAGEKPRDHSIDTRRALGQETAAPAPHPRTHLPTERQKERPVAESIPTEAADLAGRERAVLPTQRQITDDNRDLPLTAHPRASRQKDEEPELPTPEPQPAVSEPPLPPAEPAAKKDKSYLRKSDAPKLTPAPDYAAQQAMEKWGTSDPQEVSRRRTRRWALALTLLGLPLFSYMLWRLFENRQFEQKRNENQALVITAPEQTLRGQIEKASSVARAFLLAKTIDERVKHVRHPQITRDRMVKWHGPRNPIAPTEITNTSDIVEEITIEGVDFMVLKLTLKNTPREVPIGFEVTASGDYVIDWESFVSWSDPSWQEFLTKNPTTTSEYRVVVTPDDYYNYEYQDSSKHLCYRLVDAENWGSCYAYIPVDSAVINRMTAMIKRQRHAGKNHFKAILKLRFEEKSRRNNQCLIEDLVEDGWLKPAP